jgi:hypothetical protein
MVRLLFPRQPETKLEPVASSVPGDPSIILRVDEIGGSKGLPICAIFARGVALAGPVAFANATFGLTNSQVALIQQEVFSVDASIRDQITKRWYAAWRTLSQRGQ